MKKTLRKQLFSFSVRCTLLWLSYLNFTPAAAFTLQAMMMMMNAR